MKQLDFFLDYVGEGWIPNPCLRSTARDFPFVQLKPNVVDILFQNGEIRFNTSLSSWFWGRAKANEQSDWDIIAYKLSKDEKS